MLSYYIEIVYLVSTFHGGVCAVAFAAVLVLALCSEAGVNTFSEELDRSLENTAPVKSNSFLLNQSVISKYLSVRIAPDENTTQQQLYHRCSVQKVSFYENITNFRMHNGPKEQSVSVSRNSKSVFLKI